MTPSNPTPDPQTVPYATPQPRRTPRWVWWLIGGACAFVLFLLLPAVLGMLLYSVQSQPQMAPPAATGGPTPATAPAAGTGNTTIEDGR